MKKLLSKIWDWLFNEKRFVTCDPVSDDCCHYCCAKHNKRTGVITIIKEYDVVVPRKRRLVGGKWVNSQQ